MLLAILYSYEMCVSSALFFNRVPTWFIKLQIIILKWMLSTCMRVTSSFSEQQQFFSFNNMLTFRSRREAIECLSGVHEQPQTRLCICTCSTETKRVQLINTKVMWFDMHNHMECQPCVKGACREWTAAADEDHNITAASISNGRDIIC